MKKKTAVSILEYSLLGFIVVSVLVLMGGYVKRGLMNKFKQAGDAFGDGRQYDTVACYVTFTMPASVMPTCDKNGCRSVTIPAVSSYLPTSCDQCGVTFTKCTQGTTSVTCPQSKQCSSTSNNAIHIKPIQMGGGPIAG